MQFQFSGTPEKRGFGCACILCLTRPERFRQPEAWAHSPRMWRAFSLCGEWLRQPEAWAPSPWMQRAFYICGEWLRQPEAWAPSPWMQRAFYICGEWLRQPEAWAHSPRMRHAFSLRGPSTRRWSVLRKSLDRNWGPVCSVGGGGFSGAEFAPFPSTLPPTSSGEGPALLWSFSVPLFFEPPAVCSGWLIFPCYPKV